MASEFLLNGRRVGFDGTSPQTTLLDFVRSVGLTGAKEGCAEGECGACAVLLVKEVAGRTTMLSVNSCLIPLPAMADCEVYTVESLATDEKLAQVQEAMVASGGSQCGYCTPGFIVSMYAEHSRNRPVTAEALGGNLCRCTGYRPILEALESVGPMQEPRAAPAPSMRPVSYQTGEGRFSRPVSLERCFELMQADPLAHLVAGNTDLGVLTNLRHQRYRHLISVEAVPELREFCEGPESVEIGAALTLTEIEELWREPPQVFREWLPLFASPLIRNRATLGGNLMTASPIGDAAPMLLALNAVARVAGPSHERLIPLSDFFRAYRQTAAAPGEILRSILIPKPFPEICKFYKVAKRRFDDISTVAACFAGDETDGEPRNMRLAFGGMAPTPIRIDVADLNRAAQAIESALQPIGDHRGSAAYRLAVAQSLVEKLRNCS